MDVGMVTTLRTLVALACALALLVPATASAGSDDLLPAPESLHGFLYRTNDAPSDGETFPRTPAFSWIHVQGANQYELQLSTSRSFSDSSIVWEGLTRAPVITVPITLPWMTGARYSWYARVRALAGGLEGTWSAPYGFNLRAPGAPRSLSSGVNPQPGMVRWTPIDGATAYEVVFLYDQSSGYSKRILTATTAADLREYYTFHNGVDFANIVWWRVRAVRQVQGETKNKLPVASYGPWSARHRTIEAPLSFSSLTLGGSISRSPSRDILAASASGSPGPGPHELVPGFWWSGTYGPLGEEFGACTKIWEPILGSVAKSICPLYHVYVYSDADCVNRVFTSDLVGSPAWVPRLSPPLGLPQTSDEVGPALLTYLTDSKSGREGDVFDAGHEAVLATGIVNDDSAEVAPAEPPADPAAPPADPAATTTPGTVPPAEEEGSSTESSATRGEFKERKAGLWDTDWPTGRYYWTVVPTIPIIVYDDLASVGSGKGRIEYHDVLFGQDMCAAGQVMTFGKTSQVVTAGESGVPFVSGMSPEGEVVAAKTKQPSFFGRIVVAWKPAPGARFYEIQWSRQPYRWRTAGKRITPATQVQLALSPGKWFYRVRGIDPTLPGPGGLTWSDPLEVEITAPSFTVIGRS
jgi:hypothetical protein